MNLIICFLIILFIHSPAWANSQKSQVKEANEFFKKEQWDEAINGYFNALEHSQNAEIVQYDLGTAYYKKGNYDQAIEHLQKAVSDKKKGLSSRATYNLGNAFYKKGRSLEETKIDQAMASMQKSLENYDQTLRLNPKDKDAQYNKKFVEQELERLKKKKEEQSKKENQKDQSDQEQQQKDKENKEQENSKPQEQVEDKKAEEKKAEEKKADEKKSEEKKTEEGKKEQESAKQQEGQSVKGDQENLEEKHVKMLLEEYERQEEPKGLLNFIERRKGEDHVDKDW